MSLLEKHLAFKFLSRIVTYRWRFMFLVLASVSVYGVLALLPFSYYPSNVKMHPDSASVLEKKTYRRPELSWSTRREMNHFQEQQNHSADNSTLIMLWTPRNEMDNFEFNLLFQDCQSCRLTLNRSLLEQSSAVLFYIGQTMSWADLPNIRFPSQYYVFLFDNSPHHTYLLDTWAEKTKLSFREDGKRNFFNLTMTYRVDSDVVWPYAKFEKSAAPVQTDFDDIALGHIVRKKTNLIAWFVSHCRPPSKRERVVAEIYRYTQVDVFGRCWKMNCPRSTGGWNEGLDDAPACNRMLTRTYKFYLSFENSICRDYVTEKYYGTLDNSLVVPIVLERKLVYDVIPEDLKPNLKEVLNRSFIAVDDFANIKHLVDYLKYLDANTTAYLEYFEWRKHFKIIQEKSILKSGCDLCKLVQRGEKMIVEDVAEWWYDKAQCHSAHGVR